MFSIKKMGTAIKPAFSAVKPSMKFIIFNFLGSKFNKPFVFKTIFKYKVMFNILNPEWAYGWSQT